VEAERKWGNWKFRRSHWESWIKGNRFISFNLRRSVGGRSAKLNYSEKSLQSLDEYVEEVRLKKNGESPYPSSYGTVTELASYVSQVILKHLGGRWSFDEWDEVPVLVVNGQRFSPLEKTLEVLQQGDRLESWYRSLKETARLGHIRPRKLTIARTT